MDRVWGQDIGVDRVWGQDIWGQDRVWGQDIGVVRHMVMVSQGYGSGQSYRGCRDMVVDRGCRGMVVDRDMGTGLQGW